MCHQENKFCCVNRPASIFIQGTECQPDIMNRYKLLIKLQQSIKWSGKEFVIIKLKWNNSITFIKWAEPLGLKRLSQKNVPMKCVQISNKGRVKKGQKWHNWRQLQTATYQARNKLLTNFQRLESTTGCPVFSDFF